MTQQNKPKIAIIGAGSIGSLLGALLAKAGQDVTLITRPKYVDAINQKGLTVSGAFGDFQVPIKAISQLDFTPDIALLTVKTQDVESTCKEVKDFVQGIPFLTLQNGVRSDEIASSILGKDNIIGGIIMFNANFSEGGKVTSGRSGDLVIGESYQENGERVKKIADILNTGFKTIVEDNILGRRWSKLIVNIMGNSLEAMTGLQNKICLQHDSLRKLGIYLMRESFDVTHQSGIKLQPLPGLPINVFESVMDAPIFIPSQLLKLAFGNTETTSSTLQSLQRGSKSEVDYLNGEVVRRGEQYNIPTPLNSKVVELIHQIEDGHAYYSVEEVETIFRNLGAKI